MKLIQQITSQRLVLNGLTTPSFDLAQAIYAIVDQSRNSLRKWLSWVDGTHRAEDTYNYLVNWCQSGWNNETGFAYLITEQTTAKILGCVDIHPVSWQNRTGEIGYWLADEAVGHGYMQEAVHALENEAFPAGINRLVIKNDTENLRSARVAEHCGYILEGIMRQDIWSEYYQQLRDNNIWSKLKSDWEKQTQ